MLQISQNTYIHNYIHTYIMRMNVGIYNLCIGPTLCRLYTMHLNYKIMYILLVSFVLKFINL